ncbi:MAG TPA: DNA repair protein RadC [Thermoanaerobaculia bacterium]|nr:DNA repair protein RadC [Thermoanaerobaculia bacterium]
MTQPRPRRTPGPQVGRLAERKTEERPREKMLRKGPEHLDDEELLAVVLGTGSVRRPVLEMAHDLLADGGFPSLFARGAGDLRSLVHGIGPAKATRVAAILEIAARVSRDSLSRKNLLSDPVSVGRYLVERLAGETQEIMGGLLLDSKNRLVKDAPLFRGTLSHASVAPAPLFRLAILAGAAGVILYHNHPSGDPEPSPEDLASTQRFVAAGREIGIEVKDHFVIGRGRVVSFHERGLLGR